MADYLDSVMLAALSTVLCGWFAACTAGMALLTWRWRDRFYNWRRLGERDRADACLNAGLLLLFVHVTLLAFLTAYSFAFNEWQLTRTVVAISPFTIPSALLSAALVSWWVLLEMKIVRRGMWWGVLMMAGVAVCAVMVRSF